VHTTARIEVHRLGAGDWEVLRDLRLSALSTSPGALLGDPVREAARSAARWREVAEARAWFGAFEGAAAVGLASVVREPGTGHLFVESMWVAPQVRRQGVATGLLRAAERYAVDRGASVLRLWVLDGNPSAAAVYRRHGFRLTGRRGPVPGHPELIEEESSIDLPPAGGSVDDPGDDDALTAHPHRIAQRAEEFAADPLG